MPRETCPHDAHFTDCQLCLDQAAQLAGPFRYASCQECGCDLRHADERISGWCGSCRGHAHCGDVDMPDPMGTY